MADETWDDLERLAPEWLAIFGTTMPMGFEVTPGIIHIIRQCIQDRSRDPLTAYVESLPAEDLY